MNVIILFNVKCNLNTNGKRHHSQIVNICHRLKRYFFAKFVLCIHAVKRLFDDHLNKEIYLVDLRLELFKRGK